MLGTVGSGCYRALMHPSGVSSGQTSLEFSRWSVHQEGGACPCHTTQQEFEPGLWVPSPGFHLPLPPQATPPAGERREVVRGCWTQGQLSCTPVLSGPPLCRGNLHAEASCLVLGVAPGGVPGRRRSSGCALSHEPSGERPNPAGVWPQSLRQLLGQCERPGSLSPKPSGQRWALSWHASVI